MAKKSVHAEVINPDNDKDVIHVDTGSLFKPPIWSFRKAVQKLAELYPETVATDLWLVIKDRPYAEETQYEWMGYRDDVAPYIWFVYQELSDVKKNPVVTVCLWIVRCSHYYWFGGPRPERKYRPRKKNDKLVTEIWRQSLGCPTCKSLFTYEGLLTDTREEVMLHYNNWLSGHTKVCANIIWNKVELANKRKISKKEEQERLAREKQQKEEYEEWLARQGVLAEQMRQERLTHFKSLELMERALNIILEADKDEKKVVVITRMTALLKYLQTHRPSAVISKQVKFLCHKYNLKYQLKD